MAAWVVYEARVGWVGGGPAGPLCWLMHWSTSASMNSGGTGWRARRAGRLRPPGQRCELARGRGRKAAIRADPGDPTLYGGGVRRDLRSFHAVSRSGRIQQRHRPHRDHRTEPEEGGCRARQPGRGRRRRCGLHPARRRAGNAGRRPGAGPTRPRDRLAANHAGCSGRRHGAAGDRTGPAASIADLEWTVNAYTLPFAVLLMAGAAPGERYGRRRILIGGLALFGIASAGCALAPSLGWLIATRSIQGVGAAAVAPVALSMPSAAFEPQQRPRALGVFASITGLATLGGPLVGGAIVQNLTLAVDLLDQRTDRHAVDSAGLGVAGREPGRSPRRVDFAGIGLVSAAALGLVWGLIRGNESGWASGEVVVTLARGVIALVAFVGWELRTDTPLVPMRFLASRAFSAGAIAGFPSCCHRGQRHSSWLPRSRVSRSRESARGRWSWSGCCCRRSGSGGSH